MLCVLCTRANNLNILKTEGFDLFVEPGHTSFHWLDEHELHVRTSDRKHNARQASARTDIANSTRTQQGRGNHTVQNVARPQAGEFEGTNEPAFLTLRGKIGGKLARAIDRVTEECRGDRRLELQLAKLWCFT